MSNAGDPQRLLRWYPSSWRQRYGDELTALMEDSYGAGQLPSRVRMATVRSGLVERLRASGLGPAMPGESPEVGTRNGSLLVLCAWTLFVIGGAMMAKFNENWTVSTPRPDRGLPTVGFDVVQGAAALGALIVLIAGLLTVPALVRALRQHGWPLIRRQVRAITVVAGTTAVLMVLLVVWAHQLGTHQRNGGLDIYTAAFGVVGLCLIATVVTMTAAAVSLTRSLELSPRTVEWLGRVALLLTAVMAAVLGGLIVWWAALAVHAPSALGGSVPVDLVVAGVLMVAGGLGAAVGARRIVTHPLG